MSTVLARQRCLRHETREAVCRCPGCKQFFCRECVTEHGGRLLCAPCLRAELSQRPDRKRFRVARWLAPVLMPLAGLLLAWSFFYLIAWTSSLLTEPR